MKRFFALLPAVFAATLIALTPVRFALSTDLNYNALKGQASHQFDGVPLTDEDMRGLLGGEGCFGLYGTVYGSNNCCKEVATSLLIARAFPSPLTQAYAIAAGAYLIYNCT